ncbi:hypothetical protein B0J13DRAFT_85142 [Dactylonectria estremocensis]|uniref:DUF4419 domain-containing protein n=1 Tax=Dactylonectria estremocensis TaxID=1079267 RepID=A0A9P9EBI0_9HYPO|nr:hypothetical protein B0J13DRAFT_85142 [Dactylonectria estremocensis]
MVRLLHLVLVALTPLACADVTVHVASVPPLPFETSGAAASPEELFRRSCPEEVAENTELLLSSYDGRGLPAGLFPSSDGFIRGALDAWAQHRHLVLRPDEVWFEILVQLNFYMAAHAEELRDLFVTHEGKERIRIGALTWRDVVAAFGSAIQARVKTDWLLDWILPGFSTSTGDDEVTAAVLMMGLMRHFFEFEGIVICGIPSVTLRGEREDWVKLLAKLERLEAWGEEPAAFARNMRPILSRFVQTWDEPESEEVTSFWAQIVRARKKWSCGAGATEYEVSGWITGFMHWTETGQPRLEPDDEAWEDSTGVKLDGIIYEPESLEDVRVGYAKAPLKMVDYPHPGVDTQAYLLAGNVGVRRWTDERGEVILQPSSAWFLYAPADWNQTMGPDLGNGMELEDIAGSLGIYLQT